MAGEKIGSSGVNKNLKTESEWQDLARLDPLWAILSDDQKQFGGWDREEFFASGRREVDALMKSLGLDAGDNGRALDFGCGVGRLSKALCSYFGEVYGVDISEEMVRLARQYTPGCEFLVNTVDNLQVFQNDFFDFVYSNIVLQHQPSTEVAKSYIKEFVRIVKPNGTIVFQLPEKTGFWRNIQPRRRLYAILRTIGFSPQLLYKRLHLHPIRAISLSSEVVQAAINEAGGRLKRSYPDAFNRYSVSYVVSKDAV